MYSTFELEHESIKIDVEVKIVDIHFESLNDTAPDNALAGYAFFYKTYDEQKHVGLSDEEAFSHARQECIKNGYLKDFIDKEDFIMFYKDFLDYDAQLKAEGKAEGAETTICAAITSAATCIFLVVALAAIIEDPLNFFHYSGFGRVALAVSVILVAVMSITTTAAIHHIIKTFHQEKSYLTERIRELEKKVSGIHTSGKNE